MLTALVHGLVLAVGLILALGPQNVFVFSQGAIQPRLSRTLPVILATSLVATTLIVLAVGKISAALLAISWVGWTLLVFGVIFLLFIGWATWRSDRSCRRRQGGMPKGRHRATGAIHALGVEPEPARHTRHGWGDRYEFAGILGCQKVGLRRGSRCGLLGLFSPGPISSLCMWPSSAGSGWSGDG